MNGFLVLLCHTMDDLPVGLHDNPSDAMLQASLVNWDWNERQCEVFGMDGPSTPCCIKIIEFVAGKPVKSEVVREYLEEVEA